MAINSYLSNFQSFLSPQQVAGQSAQLRNTNPRGIVLAATTDVAASPTPPAQNQPDNQFIGPTLPPGYVFPTQNTTTTRTSSPVPVNNENQINNDINAIYDPAMSYLNDTANQISTGRDSVLSAANAAYNAGKSQVQDQYTTGTNQLGQYQVDAGKRKEDALAASRRLYDELRQGYNQRFGGASSAGQAASEISAREQQRQQGGISNSYEETVRTIQTQKQELDKSFQTTLLQLESSKQNAIAQAQQDFTSKMAQINNARGDLTINKGQQRLQALESLRQQVYNINNNAVQNAAAIKRQAEEQAKALDEYLNQSRLGLASTGQSLEGFNQVAKVDPTSGLYTWNRSGTAAQPVGQVSSMGMSENTRDQYNPFGLNKYLQNGGLR